MHGYRGWKVILKWETCQYSGFLSLPARPGQDTRDDPTDHDAKGKKMEGREEEMVRGSVPRPVPPPRGHCKRTSGSLKMFALCVV